jgi:hypothetical protein
MNFSTPSSRGRHRTESFDARRFRRIVAFFSGDVPGEKSTGLSIDGTTMMRYRKCTVRGGRRLPKKCAFLSSCGRRAFIFQEV